MNAVCVYQLETNPPRFELLIRIEEPSSETFLDVSNNGDIVSYAYLDTSDDTPLGEAPMRFRLLSVRASEKHSQWDIRVHLEDLSVRIFSGILTSRQLDKSLPS